MYEIMIKKAIRDILNESIIAENEDIDWDLHELMSEVNYPSTAS